MTNYTRADYDRDVTELKRYDGGGREAGAACGAGAIDYDTVQLVYDEMDRLLQRIRAYEEANKLDETEWYYDGSKTDNNPARILHGMLVDQYGADKVDHRGLEKAARYYDEIVDTDRKYDWIRALDWVAIAIIVALVVWHIVSLYFLEAPQ